MLVCYSLTFLLLLGLFLSFFWFYNIKNNPALNFFLPSAFCFLCSMYIFFCCFWGRGKVKKSLVFASKSFPKQWWFISTTHHRGWTLYPRLSWQVEFKIICVICVFLKSAVFICTYEACCLCSCSQMKGIGILVSRTNKITNTTCFWLGSGLITKEAFSNNSLKYLNT